MFLVWLLLLMPLIQQLTGIIPEKELQGDFTRTLKTQFTRSSWLNGTYQDKIIPYLDENIGFYNTLIRLNNQVNYSLFGIVNAEGVEKGRDGNFFEFDYIRGYLGDDFTGERFIEEKLHRVRYLQKFLQEEKNIHLCLIFEPTKVRFMPENLPSEYTDNEPGKSNLNTYLELAKELGINHINLNYYYLELKDKARYPLYTQAGIHWSLYGMTYCADSILDYIRYHFPPGIPDYTYSLTESHKPLRTDNDIEKALNLLFPLRSPVMAYPEYSFDTNYSGALPNVLAVADSYYFNIFNTGIPEHLFNNQAFWYFNSIVYPDNYYEPTRVEDLDFVTETGKQDFIFLMVTERFMHRFDWKFFDMLYEIHTPSYFNWPEYNYFNDIINNDAHFNELILEAKSKGLSLEEELWNNANHLFLTNSYPEYMIYNGLDRQMEVIRNDSNWYAEVTRKAAEKEIDTEEMLKLDAAYVLEQEMPKISDIHLKLIKIESELFTNSYYSSVKDSLKEEYFLSDYRASKIASFYLMRENEIISIIETIKSDPEWLSHVTEKAALRGIPLIDMIREDAAYVFDRDYKSLIKPPD
jgi:hypothetical protein